VGNLVFCAAALLALSQLSSRATVTFDRSGTAIVLDKASFPLGVFLYELNGDVLAEVHQQGFNALVCAGVWKPSANNLDPVHSRGLMTIQARSEESPESRDHPALLAWHLRDVPEMSQSIEDFAKDYMMTSAYPVVARSTERLPPVGKIADHVQEARGDTFPIWYAIQTFGGPDAWSSVWETGAAGRRVAPTAGPESSRQDRHPPRTE